MNKVFLCGTLGADPELRMTSGGKPVLNLRVATEESFKRNDKWEKVTEWHRVVCFNSAEYLSKQLQKGDIVMIEGKIHNGSYEDRDGNKKYTSEVQALTVKPGHRRKVEKEDNGETFGD